VAALPFRPGLRVVRVGDDPASAVYVRNKDRAAAAAGLDSATIHLPADTTEAALLAVVAGLNADPAVDGILVQLPLPPQIRAEAVIEALDPAKDVDGFHPLNAGRLGSGQQSSLVPCTPKGVMHLLRVAGVPLSGARAVVVGRSQIVGRPMARLLLGADCTVTVAHSRTRDLPAECRRAEILIAAAGRVAGAITPVPGGVGPMTIACLLENTLEAALARRGLAG
jgi:methylenetetrahydrofolate dehydrogenase (NADP+) / methenyltetrahydrofolate cyclohydrolase